MGLIVGILIGVGVGYAAFNQPSQSATILVTLYRSSYNEESSHYILALNGYKYTEGDLAPGESKLIEVKVSFPYGVDSAQQVIVVGSTDHSPDQEIVDVSNGGNYPLSFYV